MRRIWMVRGPVGQWLTDSEGATAWARRADAIEAAAQELGEVWPALRRNGWRVVKALPAVTE